MDAVNRYRRARYGALEVVPCRYCGRLLTLGESTVEHIVPRSKGGTHARENLDITCYDCNINKDDLSEEEFLALPPEVRFRKHRWPPRLRQARARAERIKRLTTPKKKKRRPDDGGD